MDEFYRIASVENPEESAWGIIGGGISTYNRRQAGDNHFQRLCYALYAPDQTIVGGILGEVYWEWFYIDLLWVREDLRGQGYGHRILTIAEDEARKRGAKRLSGHLQLPGPSVLPAPRLPGVWHPARLPPRTPALFLHQTALKNSTMRLTSILRYDLLVPRNPHQVIQSCSRSASIRTNQVRYLYSIHPACNPIYVFAASGQAQTKYINEES